MGITADHRQPRDASSADAAQEVVVRARQNVLRGRGPGAPRSETDRYKRERPTLGPLPAPLERELVHLNTARVRSGHTDDVDDVAIANQLDRLHEVWAPKASTREAALPVDRSRGRRRLAAIGVLAAAALWAFRRPACRR